jgi:hypothetical protein
MNWGQMGVMWKIIKGPRPQYYNQNKKKQMMRGDTNKGRNKHHTNITQVTNPTATERNIF